MIARRAHSASMAEKYFEQAAPRALARNKLNNLPRKKAWKPAGYTRTDFGSGPPPMLGALVQPQTVSGGGFRAAAKFRYGDEHNLIDFSDLHEAEMDRIHAHKRMAEELVSANQMLHQAHERHSSHQAGTY